MKVKNHSSDRKRSRPVTKRKKTDFLIENKIAAALIIVIIIIAVVTGIYLIYTENNKNNDVANEGNPLAVIETSMGTIKVELYNDKVPNTCENFIKLADDNFFDGLVFHRVANLDNGATDTHVIQGGGFNPAGNQKESIYGEIGLEIDDTLTHVDGAIAMARTTDPNSATSQFYICDGEHHFLDDSYRITNYDERGYAVFGKVTEGMNVVREIANVETGIKTLPTGQQMQNWPTEDVTINSIIIENN